MGVQHHLLLLLLLFDYRERITGAVSSISPYIKHYEGLSYDIDDLHRKHLRARRASQPQEHTLQLDFTAFHRTFRLHLKHDAAGFSENFMVVSENGSTSADLSHIYSGTLEGERGSACHGSVLQGQFEGTIHTDNGTYHIEPVHRYTSSQTDHHSIIYHEDDMVLPSMRTGPDGFCGAEPLNLLAQSLRPDEEAPASRSRRTVDESKTSCLLHLHADYLYYKRFKSIEAVIAQVTSYIRAVNDIYDKVDFDGIKLINFKVKSIRVMTEEEKDDPLNPLYIGPEKLLSLYSEKNWGNFCLSYLLTNRDYSGVLGLAWEGKAGNWGGICSKETTLRNGRTSTLNTGLITVQNYGQFLPPRHVQLTLAHELGHSLGSPHDEGSNCGNLGSRGGKGRYLMFPHATDKVRENNDKFSPCSIEHISNILKLKKDDCFVVNDQPICGNLIVEDGEECDVGHNETDLCCFSAKEAEGVQCHLKPGKACSPSQGLCCGQDCAFKSAGETCDEETDCHREGVCSGLSSRCPEPSAKENLTVCSQGTRVCLNGVCTESVCVKHSLQQCDCPGDMKEKCHMCCQQPDKPETCASTTSSVLSRHFQRKALPLVGGAPCSGNEGYCDKFHVCRLLDADGPIARLKNSFLNLEDFEDIAEWMKPICGNLIVEDGEECDVGHNETDLCCFSAKEAEGVQCHLKPGKACSPSQGLCCGQDCAFKSAGETCDEETDCHREGVCSGLSSRCPEPSAKENLTVCSQGTRVCLNGVCTESVCVKHSLQQCDCPGDMKEKCHMCCQQPDKPETCASTTSSVLSRHFQRKALPLVGGAPCSGNEGYCDKFHVCRLLDADGPIARLKNSFLNLEDFEDIAEWMKAHWWAILLAILTLSGVMGCTVCLCGRKLEDSDLE